jgi:hypothetical protein
MKHSLLAATVAILLLAGCNRTAETEAPVGTEPAPIPEQEVATPAAPDDMAGPTAGATDAIAEIDHGAPGGDTAFDAKAFAGTFAAEGTSLAIAADGTYTLTVHAESADADLTSGGTWTVQADGRELLLDPTDKSEPDRVYRIASNDRLGAEDGSFLVRGE